MGRPSLAAERVEQILDAYSRCVAQKGVDAVTIVDVSEESGLSPSHIRHYVGSKHALRDRFHRRLEERYVEDPLAHVVADAPDPLAALVDYMLMDDREPSDDDAVIGALTAGAAFDERLRERSAAGQREIVRRIVELMRGELPSLTQEDARAVAYQIAALGYGHWRLAELGVDYPRGAARSLGGRILADLRSSAR